MKNKKIFITMASFLFIFLLLFISGCNNKNYKVNYYLENKENHNTYNLFSSKDITDIKDKDKLASSFLEELKNEHYVYNSRKTKLKNNIVNFYYDLREYEITILNKTNKYKAYEVVNLPVVSLNEKLFDTKNATFLSNKIVVFNSNKIISVSSEDITKELCYLIVRLNKVKESFYLEDNDLKDPSSYPLGALVITKTLYDELETLYNKSLDDLLNNKKEEYAKNYADLVILFTKIKNEKIIGTKEDNLNSSIYNLTKMYYEKRDKLFKLFNDLNKKLDTLIIKDEIDLNNLSSALSVISDKDYKVLESIKTKVENTILYNSYRKDNKILEKAISLFDDDIELLENTLKEEKLNTIITNGKKESIKKDYKVMIYENKNLIDTKIFTGEVGSLVKYTPIEKEFTYISNESVLSATIDSKNETILKVYYGMIPLIIPINLNGGKSQFDSNYLKINYGEKIDSKIKTKLESITKEDDDYAKDYLFKHFIDSNEEVIDLNKPITKKITLNAIYTYSNYDLNYKIHIYRDLPFGKETIYPKLAEEKTSSNKINTGESLYFDPTDYLEDGFSLDYEKSELVFHKFKKTDVVKIYLKRDLLKITLDLGSGKLSDERFYDGVGNIKYGAVFNVILEGIKHEPRKKDYYTIFDKAYDVDKNEYYDLGSIVKEDLNLKIEYKDVQKIVEAKIYYSYLGKTHPTEKVQLSGGESKNKDLVHTIYIESGNKIENPAIFLPDTYYEIAEFDLDNNKGFIIDSTNKEFKKDTPIKTMTGLNKSILELNFIYRVDVKKAERIILNEYFGNYEITNEIREVLGTVYASFDNIVLLFDENGNRFLAIIENSLEDLKKDLLKPGNKLKLSGSFVKNYNEFSDSFDKTFKTGRFTDMVVTLNNFSKVELLSSNNDIPTKIEKSLIDYQDLGKVITVGDLIILDKNEEAKHIEIYEDGITNISKYLTLKAKSLNGNVIYLNLKENAPGYTDFKDLEIGDKIKLNNAVFIMARNNRVGIRNFTNSNLGDNYNLFIEDATSQLEIESKSVRKIKLNYVFNKPNDKPFTSFTNFKKEIYVNENSYITNAIKEIEDTEIYNGYHLGEILYQNSVIDENDLISDKDELTLNFVPDEKYIEFYLGSIAEHKYLKDLTLRVSKNGMTYDTSWVDYDENFYKFIISFNENDKYITLKANFNKELGHNILDNDPNSYLIVLDEKYDEKIPRYVSYEATKYNSVNWAFGNSQKKEFSLSWGEITAKRWPRNTKGMFMHAFTTEIEGDSMFADSSLYSYILTESSGLPMTDAELNINKDHNMRTNMYAPYEGSRFYLLPQKTNEEINSDSTLNIRSFQTFSKLDKRKDGTEYKTNETQKFYFYKDSLTKLVKLNKFGLGVVFVDLNPTLEVDGNIYKKPNKENHTIPYKWQDSKLTLEKDNRRVFTTKEEFFNYLEDKKIPTYSLPSGNYLTQQLTRKRFNITFNILNSDKSVFNNNKKTLTLRKKYLDDITTNELEIKELGKRDILFINPDKGELVEFKYNYNLTKDFTYDIILLEKEERNLRIYAKDINTIDVNNENITPRTDTKKEQEGLGNIKDYKIFVYLTDEFSDKYPNLSNIFTYKDSQEEYNIKIPFNIDKNAMTYHIIPNSDEIVLTYDNTRYILFIMLDSGVKDDLEKYYFKVTYKDNTIIKQDIKYYPKENIAALILNISDGKELTDIKEISLWKENSKLRTGYLLPLRKFIQNKWIGYHYIKTSNDTVAPIDDKKFLED